MTSQWQLCWSRSDNFIRIDLVKIDNVHSKTVVLFRAAKGSFGALIVILTFEGLSALHA